MQCDAGRPTARSMTQAELREAIEGHLPRRDPYVVESSETQLVLCVPAVTTASKAHRLIQAAGESGFRILSEDLDWDGNTFIVMERESL